MALPGGKRAPEDPTLFETAIRETEEEVGLDLRNGHFLGALDDLTPRTSSLPPVIVRPHVFALNHRSELRPQGTEVAEVFWSPFAAFFQPRVFRSYDLVHSGIPISMPGYHLDRGVVWGLTERILTPLFETIHEIWQQEC